MSDRTTWIAPVTGTYHFFAFGTPHLVAECGPHCTSYLELPEGTTVIAFDASPAEYAVRERPLGIIEAPVDMPKEQIAAWKAAWDDLASQRHELRVLHACGARLLASELAGHECEATWPPRFFDYPVGGGDGC